MVGLAADDAAQRDVAVVAGRRREASGLLGQGDGAGDLQRAGLGDDVVLRAERAQRLGRAVQQGVGQVVIEARLDDEDADGLAYDWSSPSMSRQPTMRRP